MHDFTPISAAAGGLLVGISASLLWLLNGRIAGISGVVGGLLAPWSKDSSWRVFFLVGLLGAAFVGGLWHPELVRATVPRSPAAMLVAGALVGYGARLGNGCTSGHSMCGIARFSPRSIVFSCVYFAVGAAVTFVVGHLLGGSI